MKFLFCAEQDGAAQARQRSSTPAAGLLRLGHQADVTSYSVHPNAAHAGDPRLRGISATTGVTTPADVVVMRLVDQLEAESIRRARAAGQIVLFDFDDDVWNLPPDNPSRLWLMESGKPAYPGLEKQRLAYDLTGKTRPRSIDLAILEANMNACDAVIASTTGVAASALDAGIHVPVLVIRNCVDAGLYRPHAEDHSPLRIGWLGTLGFGLEALRLIAEPLGEVLRGSAATLWHLGYEDDAQADADAIFEATGLSLGGAWPWVPALRLGDSLTHIDLAVVPRVPSRFTDSQSYMTGLSLAAAGVPFVATATAEYRRLAELGIGYTAQSAEDWTRALRHLIADPAFRHTSAKRARARVIEHHSPVVMGRRYLWAIRKLAELDAQRRARAATN